MTNDHHYIISADLADCLSITVCTFECATCGKVFEVKGPDVDLKDIECPGCGTQALKGEHKYEDRAGIR
jgi:hypothetical protein